MKFLLFIALTAMNISDLNAENCKVMQAKKQTQELIDTLFSQRDLYEALPIPNLIDALIREIDSEIAVLQPFQLAVIKKGLETTNVTESLATYLSQETTGAVAVGSYKMILYRAVLNHPIAAIVGRHELKHLLRFTAKPVSSYFESQFKRHQFDKREESIAWGEQYDFIKRHIRADSVSELKEIFTYRSAEQILSEATERGLIENSENRGYKVETAAVMELLVQEKSMHFAVDVLALTDTLNYKQFEKHPSGRPLMEAIATRKLDRQFIADIENVHSMSRQEYIDHALEGYHLPEKLEQDQARTRRLSLSSIAGGVAAVLFYYLAENSDLWNNWINRFKKTLLS